MRLLLLFGVLAICVLAVIVILIRNMPVFDSSEDPHNLWLNHNIENYHMTMVVIALPAPPSALNLEVQGGDIVNETIIACENPSPEFPARWCEPTRTYYSYMARVTIDELFDRADQCLHITRLALTDCPLVSDDFQAFEDSEEMFQVAKSCESYLSGFSDSLCVVQYNQTYGYPEEIYTYIPDVTDGSSTISVKDFHLSD